MSCKITTHERGDVTIITSAGRMTLGAGVLSLRYTIGDLIRQGKNKIIINLADTIYVDHDGFGELASSMRKVTGSGSGFKLLSLPPRTKKFLEDSGLYPIFEIFENEDDAVQSFR